MVVPTTQLPNDSKREVMKTEQLQSYTCRFILLL